MRTSKEGRHPAISISVDGDLISNPEVICNEFASFFQSTFTPSSSFSSSPVYNQTNLPLAITAKTVLECMSSLKPSISAGVDGIPSLLVRAYRDILAPPLCELFNRCIQEGTFPELWNTAKVLPLHKSGDRSEVSCYRPISICNTFSKVFEKALITIWTPIVDAVLVDEQHGFRKKRSTITNLSSFMSWTLPLVSAGTQVDCLYLDWAKAFDRVPHDRLLEKIRSLPGLAPYVPLLASYLAGRKCIVAVNGACSAPYTPTSGVHQGSNLGPLLFNVLVNDVVKEVECGILLYADDMKLYTQVTSTNDALKLQKDLTAICNWGISNSMVLNADKCQVVSFSRKKEVIVHKYQISGTTLTRPNSIRDLGVIFTSSLKFSEWVRTSVPRAMRVLGLVRSVGMGLSLDCIVALYKALVRPILEYAVPIWNGITKSDSNELERVQRLFIRVVFCRYFGYGYYYSYTRICHKLSLPSLLARRHALETSFFLNGLIGFVFDPYIRTYVSLLPASRRRGRIFHVTSFEDLFYFRVIRSLNLKCLDPSFLSFLLTLTEGNIKVPFRVVMSWFNDAST